MAVAMYFENVIKIVGSVFEKIAFSVVFGIDTKKKMKNRKERKSENGLEILDR